MRDLRGKVAFITGGTSGIGLGIGKALVESGADLVLTYLQPEQLEPALEALRSAAPQSRVHPIRLDVTDRKAVHDAAAESISIFGKLHIVCNAAGVNLFGPMDEATFEDWDWVLGVNLQGTLNVVISALPHIKQHGEGGHIINVGSMGSFISGPTAGVYTTSKFAVRGFTEVLRYSLVRHGIGVSLVCPGLTRSAIAEAPLHRPQKWRDATRPVDMSMVERARQVHAAGMDPDEVGRITIQAVLRNEPYVFSHPEFRDEIRADAEEVARYIPEGNPPLDRLAVETARKRLKAETRAQIEQLTQSAYLTTPR